MESPVVAAVQASRLAQPAWASSPYRERAQKLLRVRQLLLERADELAHIITRDNGKVLVDSLATEILPTVMAVGYYIKAARRVMKPRTAPGGNLLLFNKRNRLQALPYGVVGIISPWNYPFTIPFSEVVMALLTGNGVILKVASDTLEVGQALADLFLSAGLPAGLFGYVVMPGSQAGPAFLEARVDKLFFTGSTEVGRTLMALAAPTLTPLVLELGGNDAAYVRADADLVRAANGILWSGFSNAGQSCGGAQRILVHESVYDAFVEALGSLVRNLRVGPGGEWSSDMGAMTSAKQKQTVEDQVAACIASGAIVAAKSAVPDKGHFLPAIVLTNVTSTMHVMNDEVFGPVVAIMKVGSDDEAIQIANSSPLGLTSSVWSRDHKTARELARRIHAGAILINDHLMSHGLSETPWGGFGDSGMGRTHGEAGLAEMVRIQVVVDDLMPWTTKNIWWHPYSEKVYQGLKALLRLLYGPGLGKRIGAIPKVLGVFFRYWER